LLVQLLAVITSVVLRIPAELPLSEVLNLNMLQGRFTVEDLLLLTLNSKSVCVVSGPLARHLVRYAIIKCMKISVDLSLFLSVNLTGNTIILLQLWEVSAFTASFWQRIDIAFHSASHSVTPLPFLPQGLLS